MKAQQAEKLNSNHTNLMIWDVLLMEVVEVQVVETEIVVREPEVALIDLLVVQFEFALLLGIVPQ